MLRKHDWKKLYNSRKVPREMTLSLSETWGGEPKIHLKA